MKLIICSGYFAIAGILASSGLWANMPVVDFSNLFQNSTTAIESVAQTRNQVLQYQTQLEQYRNMLENSKNLSSFNWDEASSTMGQLMEAVNTIDYHKQQAGSMDKYLSQYQSVDWHESQRCKRGGCSEADIKAIRQGAIESSRAGKRANDAAFKGIDQQQKSLKEDARKLGILQKNAQDARGQMQAIQAANQLASAENNQLLQIRGVLVSQQNMVATQAAVAANKEAMHEAGDARFRAGTFKKSPPRSW